jgi:flagellar protein FlaI
MSLRFWRSTGGDAGRSCACRPAFVESTGTGIRDWVELHVDATACEAGGDLSVSPPCRATVVDALSGRDADVVRVRAGGRERTYADAAAGLLLAAGRFASLVDHHDAGLAARAKTDPLGAAREATGRAGPVARLAAETGLAEGANRVVDDDEAFRCHVGPTIAQSRVDLRPPDQSREVSSVPLATGARAVVCCARDGDGATSLGSDSQPRYHLVPAESQFDAADFATLAEAVELVAGADTSPLDPSAGDDGAQQPAPSPASAVRAVASPDDPVGVLTSVLRKHTRGNGVLDDLFADDRVSDVYVTAPAPANPVRVVCDGKTMPTNVRLTPTGVATLASRLRRVSGRGFSRATPRIDASLSVGPGDESVRAAGVTRPLADGPAFAFRRHDEEAWTLARLVAVGSLTPRAAAFLSLAVERGATGLVAGARGAGKTTTLGSLLWALPRATRTVVVEDTPELPVDHLQAAGQDVQALRVARGDSDTAETTPEEALRTALRLGDGALVVGEVRGQEAGVLYEAMRVGAASNAVLGTVHGDGAAAVRTRLTEDLGVSDRSFAATGFVLTMADTDRGRRTVAVEEVYESGSEDSSTHSPLFDLDAGGNLTPTGRLDRGESTLLADLTAPNESYGDALAVLDARETRYERLAANGATSPRAVREFDGSNGAGQDGRERL